jgi:hypothetical protein
MVLNDDFVSAPNLAFRHVLSPDQSRTAIAEARLILACPSEHMDMSRFMVVDEDDYA